MRRLIDEGSHFRKKHFSFQEYKDGPKSANKVVHTLEKKISELMTATGLLLVATQGISALTVETEMDLKKAPK